MRIPLSVSSLLRSAIAAQTGKDEGDQLAGQVRSKRAEATRKAGADNVSLQAQQALIALRNAQTAKANAPATTPRDPVADHAANRDYDIKHPLPRVKGDNPDEDEKERKRLLQERRRWIAGEVSKSTAGGGVLTPRRVQEINSTADQLYGPGDHINEPPPREMSPGQKADTPIDVTMPGVVVMAEKPEVSKTAKAPDRKAAAPLGPRGQPVTTSTPHRQEPTGEDNLTDADLYEKKRDEGLTAQAAEVYVRNRASRRR